MKVKVKLFRGAKKAITEAQKIAMKKTGQQMRKEIIQEGVIPFDEGTLQNVQTRVDDSAMKSGLLKIIHDTDYAQRLYWHPEYDFQTTNNANAQGLWWEDWIEGSKKDRPKKIYKEFLKKEAGGYIR